jgi:hypothetical protein
MSRSPFQFARCGSVLIPRSRQADANALSTPEPPPWMIVIPGPYRPTNRRTIDVANFWQVQNPSPVTRIRMNTTIAAGRLSV